MSHNIVFVTLFPRLRVRLFSDSVDISLELSIFLLSNIGAAFLKIGMEDENANCDETFSKINV